MAGHNEIKVGSRGEWVVRKDGADVSVVVVNKVKKASGRGYEFVLKEVRDGRVSGREFTRGSGAFRKPGQPAKSFGGKRTAPPRKAAVRKKASRPAAKHGPVEPPETARSRSRPSISTPNPAPYTPALPSLRGRGRSSSRISSSVATRAPARTPAKEEGIRFSPPSPLAKEIMRAIEKTDGSEFWIRKAFADVMARASIQQTYGHLNRGW